MIRKATLAGVLFSLWSIGSLLHGGEFVNIIAAAAAATTPAPSPTPAPTPAPSADCDNCGGSGKLGDGTVSVTCPVCDGTGKRTTGTTPAATAPARKPAALVPPKVLKQAAAARRGYPVRSGWWTVNGGYLENYAHLTTGRHAGRYDTAWLKTLTREQLNALHADDHENRVNWNYAVRPAKAPVAKAAGRWVMQRFCTGNGCVWRRVWVEQ